MLGLAIQKPEGHYVYLTLYFKADADGRQLCSRPAVLHKCLNHVLLTLMTRSLLWQQESH